MTKQFDSPEQLAALDGAVQEFALRGVTFQAKPTMHARDFGLIAGAVSMASDGDLFETVSAAIRRTLLPEYRTTWDELLAKELDIPITFKTVSDIGAHLMEGATGRPTPAPLPSGITGARTTTGSTDGSGSQEERESALSASGLA